MTNEISASNNDRVGAYVRVHLDTRAHAYISTHARAPTLPQMGPIRKLESAWPCNSRIRANAAAKRGNVQHDCRERQLEGWGHLETQLSG